MKIDVYCIDDCPICDDVVEDLKDAGLHYHKLDAKKEEIKIMADIAYKDRTTDFDLPVVYIDDSVIITGDDFDDFDGGARGLFEQLKGFNRFKTEYDCEINNARLITLIEKKKGNCLCKLQPTKCVPKECAKMDIVEKGKCKCRVFERKQSFV